MSTERYPGYEEQRAILITYLKVQVARNDWHGVSDAANDLRVIEAQMEAYSIKIPKP